MGASISDKEVCQFLVQRYSWWTAFPWALCDVPAKDTGGKKSSSEVQDMMKEAQVPGEKSREEKIEAD